MDRSEQPSAPPLPLTTWPWGALQAVTVSLAVLSLLQHTLDWLVIAAFTWIGIAVIYRSVADWLEVWRGGRLRLTAKLLFAAVAAGLYGGLVVLGLLEHGLPRILLFLIGLLGCAPMAWSLVQWVRSRSALN